MARCAELVTKAFVQLNQRDQREVRKYFSDEYGQELPQDPIALGEAMVDGWSRDLPYRIPQSYPAAVEVLDAYLNDLGS
ncbi:MAG: hypothetical protein ACYDHY_06825 [Acidiferrobacterales bacterium]